MSLNHSQQTVTYRKRVSVMNNNNQDILELIPSMQQTRKELSQNEIYRKELKKQIDNMNKRIEYAKNKGYSSTCWCVYEHEHQIRAMYKEKGYTFKPTGYVGGVWQETEDICW